MRIVVQGKRLKGEATTSQGRGSIDKVGKGDPTAVAEEAEVALRKKTIDEEVQLSNSSTFLLPKHFLPMRRGKRRGNRLMWEATTLLAQEEKPIEEQRALEEGADDCRSYGRGGSPFRGFSNRRNKAIVAMFRWLRAGGEGEESALASSLLGGIAERREMMGSGP
ncbi:hypothetical protein B296_00024917 [Ensete ventricosum]|uniref:Uncharacterized protein n=1 Tax=Ensete ventricosum TaxID=4639 RepID=A0A427A796_ENSVE|nr:hypothetical protein B296_00024917 [Ensete ventricosum]